MANSSEIFEKYTSGALNKPKIDKTGKDWIVEWIRSLAITSIWSYLFYIFLFSDQTVVSFLKIFDITNTEPWLIVLKCLSFLMFPIVFVIAIIFIIRTITTLSFFIFTDMKATDLKVTESEVRVYLYNGKTDIFSNQDIESISVLYNYRGVYVNSRNKKCSYTLPVEPAFIEQKIDLLRGFSKEVSSLESKEGNIRYVRYTINNKMQNQL